MVLVTIRRLWHSGMIIYFIFLKLTVCYISHGIGFITDTVGLLVFVPFPLSRIVLLSRSRLPVLPFALNASIGLTRFELWQSACLWECSLVLSEKLILLQWNKYFYHISRMTVNKIIVWIWRWRVWKVKKVMKTTAPYQTAKRTVSTTKVNR